MKIAIITILCYSAVALVLYILSDERVITEEVVSTIIGGPFVWAIGLFALLYHSITDIRRKNMDDEQRKIYNKSQAEKEKIRKQRYTEKQKKYWTVERQTTIARKYLTAFVNYSKKSGHLPAIDVSSYFSSDYCCSNFDCFGELCGVPQNIRSKFEHAYFVNSVQMDNIIKDLSRPYTKDDYIQQFDDDYFNSNICKNIRIITL